VGELETAVSHARETKHAAKSVRGQVPFRRKKRGRKNNFWRARKNKKTGFLVFFRKEGGGCGKGVREPGKRNRKRRNCQRANAWDKGEASKLQRSRKKEESRQISLYWGLKERKNDSREKIEEKKTRIWHWESA